MTDIITKLREPRIGGIAVFDLGGTILGGILLAKYFDWNPWVTVGGTLVVGEAVHLLLGIDTTVTQKITQTVNGPGWTQRDEDLKNSTNDLLRNDPIFSLSPWTFGLGGL